jgi:hypothetical protein
MAVVAVVTITACCCSTSVAACRGSVTVVACRVSAAVADRSGSEAATACCGFGTSAAPREPSLAAVVALPAAHDATW